MRDIGTLLQGVSAGLSGDLPKFNAMQDQRKMFAKQEQEQEQQKQQALSKERLTAIVQDAYHLQRLIGLGKMDAAVKLVDNRIESINKLGGDPADTLQAKELLTSGDPAKFQQLQKILQDTVDAGAIFWQPPEAAQMSPADAEKAKLAREKFEWQKNNPSAGAAGQTPASIQEIAYYNSLPDGAEKEAVGRKIGMISKEGAVLSPYAEKQIDLSGTDAARLGSEASRYDSIATDLEQQAQNMPSGKLSAFNEMIKSFTGNEDDITSLRKKALQVVNTEAIKNLPAGSATEKDVEMAVAPLPSQNADPIYIAKWLKSIANLNRKASEFAEFKANFISENGSVRTKSGESLIAAWKRQQEEGMRSAPSGATPGIAPSSATGQTVNWNDLP